MKKKNIYPQEFIDICDWVDEKVARRRVVFKLEQSEKKQLQMLFGVVMILMLFIIFAFSNQGIKTIAWIIFIISLASLIIYSILTNLKMVKKKVEFKKDVLEEFAIHIKDGFIYEQNGEISESKYRKSGFDKSYNEFFSNSYMDGDRDGRNIGLANVIVKRRDNKTNNLKEVFNGAFAFSSLKLSTNEIDIMKVNSTKNTREKYFINSLGLYMYADDIGYAKRVIDESIIEEINNIKKELNLTLECMVNKDMLYVRFFVDNMNNTLLFGTEKEREVLYKYYRIINFMDFLSRKIEDNILENVNKEEIYNKNEKKEEKIETQAQTIPKVNQYENTLVKESINLDNFKIYPKIDFRNFAEEFEDEIKNSEGVEIQFFDEKGQTSNIDIKTKVKAIIKKYPNLKEITIHPPVKNYDIEHVLFKNEKIFEKQLHDIVNISKKYKITVNLLYHTTWNISTIISTGLINKIKKYLKILEGHNTRLLIENVYIIDEDTCTPLEVCKLINHPNLKACIDITHVHTKANIWRKNIFDYANTYLNRELCEKYVHQIHFSAVLENDGYIDRKHTHGRVHETQSDLALDLRILAEYNLLNKILVTEISEDDYKYRPDELKEIRMLREEIKKYM